MIWQGWEPSDRKDRRIQRRKMKIMWRELRQEQARQEMIPVYTRKQPHYVGREPYVDVTSEMDRALIVVIAAFALWGMLLCLAVR